MFVLPLDTWYTQGTNKLANTKVRKYGSTKVLSYESTKVLSKVHVRVHVFYYCRLSKIELF